MHKMTAENVVKNERGSLALEQVLFIAAIIALSGGLYAFYNNLGGYFTSVDFTAVPTAVPAPTAPTPGP